MPDHVLESRLWLRRPRPEVFAFFADPRNLGLLSPPWAPLAWLRPPPVPLVAGDVLDFDVRVLGLRFGWRVLVRELDAPYRFVDAQLWGPFARWEHRHRFLEGPEQPGLGGPVGTWVEDRLTYRPPLGPVGEALHAMAGGRWIARLFAHRDRRLRQLLG